MRTRSERFNQLDVNQFNRKRGFGGHLKIDES